MRTSGPAVLAIAFFISVTTKADMRNAIGYVEEFEGTVLIKAAANAPPVRLSEKVDIARRIWSGDQIRCEKGSWVRLRIGREAKTLRAASTWFVLHRPRVIPRNVEDALREYGRVGGRSKGSPATGLQLYSPSEGSVIRPETFEILWNPGTEDCPLSVLIRTMDHADVWRQMDAPATRGTLDPAAVRKALAEHRASGKMGRLELTLADRCSHQQNVTFDVLSSQGEQELNDELREWKESTNDFLLLSLGRASIFARSHLFVEVAAEYDDALTAAPESKELLARAIAAHERTGNAQREKDLRDRLNRLSGQ